MHAEFPVETRRASTDFLARPKRQMPASAASASLPGCVWEDPSKSRSDAHPLEHRRRIMMHRKSLSLNTRTRSIDSARTSAGLPESSLLQLSRRNQVARNSAIQRVNCVSERPPPHLIAVPDSDTSQTSKDQEALPTQSSTKRLLLHESFGQQITDGIAGRVKKSAAILWGDSCHVLMWRRNTPDMQRSVLQVPK